MLQSVSDFLNYGYRVGLRWILRMDSQDWTYVFVAVVVFGVLCMRGFKSQLRA